ncbi:MAG: enoyl-CoA hydratase-related protein, partial [Candidatus Acidiferrum sp.]
MFIWLALYNVTASLLTGMATGDPFQFDYGRGNLILWLEQHRCQDYPSEIATTLAGEFTMAASSVQAEASLLLEVRDSVAYWTLNRIEKRNALSWQLLSELEQAVIRVGNDESVRAVVLAANGPVFSSGHDLAEMTGRAREDYDDLFSLCSRVMLGLRHLPQPVIARVQGTATAAGCQLVATCDLAVAAEEATFATPGVKIGLFCTTPMVPLVRTIPPRAA